MVRAMFYSSRMGTLETFGSDVLMLLLLSLSTPTEISIRFGVF